MWPLSAVLRNYNEDPNEPKVSQRKNFIEALLNSLSGRSSIEPLTFVATDCPSNAYPFFAGPRGSGMEIGRCGMLRKSGGATAESGGK